MENTFYVVNEVYTTKDGQSDAVILEYYTQDKDDFIDHIRNLLGLHIPYDYDGNYRYFNGYEMFKTDKIELLEYIYEYPINFTDKIRDVLKIKEDTTYDLTIAYYTYLLREQIQYITPVEYKNYDIIDINNDILIECEQGYFLHYLIHIIQEAFDKKDLPLIINSIVESYTK
jgi:hypothetical protein